MISVVRWVVVLKQLLKPVVHKQLLNLLQEEKLVEKLVELAAASLSFSF